MTSYDQAIESDLDELADLESQTGYLAFLNHVVVDAQPDKRAWWEIAEPWQQQHAARHARAIDQLAGISSGYEGPLQFWNGWMKGHDKTHAAARRVCFLLGWSRRRLTMYAVAGDKDQAKLLTQAMRGVLADNRWIAERVSVSDYKATGASGSELIVMPMEHATGQGIFPDYVDVEEMSHWKHAAGKQFWEFVLSSIGKRPQCVVEVNTNAGYQGSWQWEERCRIEKSKYWDFHEQAAWTPLASWMDQEKIADDSQGMEQSEVDRLFGNKWSQIGGDDPYITLEQAEACVRPNLQERTHCEVGSLPHSALYDYYAIVDYGGAAKDAKKADRCALGVLHAIPQEYRCVVDRLDCWQRGRDGPILLDVPADNPHARCVEGWLDLTIRNFVRVTLVIDPYQMESLAQKFERRGVRVIRFEYQAGKANYRMAQVLREAVRNRRVSWSPRAGLLPGIGPLGQRIADTTLALEMSRLVKVPTSYGYRFDHENSGHDDRCACIGMALIHALPEAPPGFKIGVEAVKAEAKVMRHNPVLIPPKTDFAQRWNLNGCNLGGEDKEQGEGRNDSYRP